MDHDWSKELAALTRLGVSELRGKYADLKEKSKDFDR
jgi:hypothetical protein